MCARKRHARSALRSRLPCMLLQSASGGRRPQPRSLSAHIAAGDNVLPRAFAVACRSALRRLAEACSLLPHPAFFGRSDLGDDDEDGGVPGGAGGFNVARVAAHASKAASAEKARLRKARGLQCLPPLATGMGPAALSRRRAPPAPRNPPQAVRPKFQAALSPGSAKGAAGFIQGINPNDPREARRAGRGLTRSAIAADLAPRSRDGKAGGGNTARENGGVALSGRRHPCRRWRGGRRAAGASRRMGMRRRRAAAARRSRRVDSGAARAGHPSRPAWSQPGWFRFNPDHPLTPSHPPPRCVTLHQETGRGTSTSLTKQYLRLTSAPEASAVRPPKARALGASHLPGQTKRMTTPPPRTPRPPSFPPLGRALALPGFRFCKRR